MVLEHTWARFLAQYRYCTDGTPKNFVQKNLYQRYQVRTEGTHGKTFLADLQLVRTDGTNGKKNRADLPLVRTDGTNEKSFLTELPLVHTDGTKWKNFLNFCPKITKKWLKMAKSGQKKSEPKYFVQKNLYRWYIFQLNV